jgi:anti-anti-sigma factor
MKHLSLTHNAAKADPSVTVVQMEGELDSASTLHFDNYLMEILGKKRFRIVLDMKNLHYVSVTGFALLMTLANKTRKMDGDLKIAEVSPPVLQILKLLGFQDYVRVYESVDEAVRAF